MAYFTRLKPVLYRLIALLFSALFFAAAFYTHALSVTYVYGKEVTDEYARIITDDTPLYSDKDGTQAAFYIPYTYYVKVVAQGELLSKVEYGCYGQSKVEGYVPTEMLFYDGQTVTSPYPELTVKTAATTPLYADGTLTNVVKYVFYDREMHFLGFYKAQDGSYLCFVEYDSNMGYVKESDVLPFTLPQHSNELTFLKPPETEENEVPDTNGFDGLKIAVIACLVAAGVFGLVFALRKKPETKNDAAAYYDENDYE